MSPPLRASHLAGSDRAGGEVWDGFDSVSLQNFPILNETRTIRELGSESYETSIFCGGVSSAFGMVRVNKPSRISARMPEALTLFDSEKRRW